jgi:glucose/arabinose dehydrogenase
MSSARAFISPLVILAVFAAAGRTAEGALGKGDDAQGKAFFQQNCALCHATTSGTGSGQGPSLVGVIGRSAASAPNFGYSKAMAESGITWDLATLDRFLSNPSALVPGTTMPVPVPDEANRANVIAFLATLKAPAMVSASAAAASAGLFDPADWRNAHPGVKHHITVADLPPPFKTASAGNGPQQVKRPAGAELSVPPGFTVKPFVTGLTGPRLVRIAPNGDIFVAETNINRIRVLRAADGAEAPAENQIFADGLDRPFGLAFYPAGANPEWIYVANNNSVVRFPYRNGDLKVRAGAQVIVPRLAETTGGHTTRDVAFSKDGTRLFISVGSGSNVAEDIGRKSPDAIKLWESTHLRGSAWGSEADRADILVVDPEGHGPVRIFAAGVRNGVGLAVNPLTGDLWVSTNERDGLGDDLVPDYVTRIKEGGYYGWPWYYIGNNEDPRHAGERPDLAGQAIVPDVLLQAHSASLEMTFYEAEAGPAVFPPEYRGEAFAALHGSWNRSIRTGYKVVRAHLVNGIPTGEYEDFLTGFVADDRGVWGRPVGVAVAHDGALLVTDDGSGTIWRVAYTGH